MATAAPAVANSPGPNGQLAFTRYDPSTGEPHVFIANPDGTHERQLPSPAPSDVPVWSPDGRELVVFRLGAPARPATVRSDGSGFKVLEIPGLPQDVDVVCTDWSPTGARLLCAANRAPGEDPSLSGVYTIRASDGGGLRRLTTGTDSPGNFSPDGRRFVFARGKPGPDPTHPDIGQSAALFVKNTDGTGLRQITPYGLAFSHDAAKASWSPDGTRILFGSERGALFVIRPDGTGLRKIHLEKDDGRSFAFTPGWSPDGTRIVFSLFVEEAGQVDIYRARSDGRQLVRVTRTAEREDFGEWGPAPLAG
jgi:Tol biopolymer transport system component